MHHLTKPPGRIACLVLLSILALLVSGCVDLRPPVPNSAYRAAVSIRTSPVSDAEQDIDETEIKVVEFYQDQKWRREARLQDQPQVLIDRPDLRVSWRLHDQKKSFDESPIAEVDPNLPWSFSPFGPRARSKADFTLEGVERISGIEAQKYDVRGEHISGTAWVTLDRIPLRFRGLVTRDDATQRIEIDYDDVSKGSLAGWLFAIPPNFEGYEERTKIGKKNRNVDSETVRRAAERLKNDQIQGPTPQGVPF